MPTLRSPPHSAGAFLLSEDVGHQALPHAGVARGAASLYRNRFSLYSGAFKRDWSDLSSFAAMGVGGRDDT